MAVGNRHRKIVELLIERNAGVDIVNKLGQSALSIAIRLGDAEVVKILVQEGRASLPSKKEVDKMLTKGQVEQEQQSKITNIIEQERIKRDEDKVELKKAIIQNNIIEVCKILNKDKAIMGQIIVTNNHGHKLTPFGAAIFYQKDEIVKV
jgi:ankyrin repeat protein